MTIPPFLRRRSTPARPVARGFRPCARGFTLVELMVAMTGGFLVAVTVFTLARDGAHFYQNESRVANATFSTVVGFQRLRHDLARAGFLSTPNIQRDDALCGSAAAWGLPTGMGQMQSVRITQGGSLGSPTLLGNNLRPDAILLSGSYGSSDLFPVNTVEPGAGGYAVYLQPNSGPMSRTGYLTATDPKAALAAVFATGRGLRILDKTGRTHYGAITDVVASPQPYVQLSDAPALVFRVASGTTQCGLHANDVGVLASVVNFVHYEVRKATGTQFLDTLYAPSFTQPSDTDRTELVREELDTAGLPIEGTEEVVAEYAVDLRFGLTWVTSSNGLDANAFETADFDDARVGSYSNYDPAQAVGPANLRSVRVRLGLRSRSADRPEAMPVSAPLGVFRIGLGAAGTAPFARVRTLQADIALRNQMGSL